MGGVERLEMAVFRTFDLRLPDCLAEIFPIDSLLLRFDFHSGRNLVILVGKSTGDSLVQVVDHGTDVAYLLPVCSVLFGHFM